MNKEFEKICRMSQEELKRYLTNRLKSKYNNITEMNGFVYAEGSFPVLLVAHMDTVHKDTVKQIVYTGNGKDNISSPQGIGGDDRCGIYMILQIIEKFDCHVLFTEDEEIGCVGADKYVNAIEDGFVAKPNVNYIIELDRKGDKDAVFYQCDNPEFEDFILQDKDWHFAYGSFTDIVEIAPIIGAAAVNFSCGYYNAHTTTEYVVLSEMYNNIDKVIKLLGRTTENDKYEYIEAQKYYRSYNGNLYNFGYGYGYGYEDSWYNDTYESRLKTYYIAAQGKNRKYIEEEIYATSEDEAVGQFLTYNPDICYNDICDILSEDDCK